MKASAAIRRAALCLLAFASGAGAMYFADPEAGRRRRAAILDKLSLWLCYARFVNDPAGDGIQTRSERQDASADASGIQRPGGADATRDKMLLDEVRAQLERHIAHSTLLSVTVQQGRVIVSGPVKSGESDAVERSLRSVAGLSGFQLSITEYQQESEMPGLQAQKIWDEQYS
ncbi:MAG: hypothetical protein M3007_02210 [Candidatus Eremiobacteraeota bacterium]|nr:hypothetical protein [Candidatus Eremiobacteraeota bacterium]